MKSLRSLALALAVLGSLAPQAEAGSLRAKRAPKHAVRVDASSHASGFQLVAFYQHLTAAPAAEVKALSLPVARLRRR